MTSSDPPIPPLPAETDESGSKELSRLVFYSLLTGLCPMIPVPFLDDWARDFLRRRMVFELASGQGQALDSEQTRLLAMGKRQPAKGCLRGCLFFVVIKPTVYFVLKIVKKIFRKVLIFLTIKDCVDTFSQTFHEAYMIAHALERNMLSGADPALLETRRAIEQVKTEVDPRPIEKIVGQSLQGSYQLLKRAAGVLGALMRRERRREKHGEGDPAVQGYLPVEEEEQLLGGLVAGISRRLRRQESYLHQLESCFERQMALQKTHGDEETS